MLMELKEFDIKITQTLEGHVKIKAESAAEACKIADTLYNGHGAELPDMDDVSPLRFSVEMPRQPEVPKEVNTGPLTQKEVEQYLIRHGYPHPDVSQIEYYVFGGEKQFLFDEAIRNNYDLCDVDRWAHLYDLTQTPFPFNTAMYIENSLWEADDELLEMNSILDICEAQDKAFIRDLTNIASQFINGSVTDNPYSLSVQDIAMLTKEFAIALPEKLVQQVSQLHEFTKPSLSSIIHSADSRRSSLGTTANKNSLSIESER